MGQAAQAVANLTSQISGCSKSQQISLPAHRNSSCLHSPSEILQAAQDIADLSSGKDIPAAFWPDLPWAIYTHPGSDVQACTVHVTSATTSSDGTHAIQSHTKPSSLQCVSLFTVQNTSESVKTYMHTAPPPLPHFTLLPSGRIGTGLWGLLFLLLPAIHLLPVSTSTVLRLLRSCVNLWLRYLSPAFRSDVAYRATDLPISCL